jgi:uncharacterized membrane protein YjjP (DUF1212 family)
MLKNGAEISRVEDTIERICKAYGAAHIEVFSIISFIDAAIRMPDGSYSSQVRRIKSTGMNLDMLERLNALSREICKTTPELEKFDEMIHKLKKAPTYPLYARVLASSAAVGGFALFFGGSIKDAIVAMFIGAIICMIETYSSKRVNSMAKIVVSSFFATLIAGLSVKFGLGDSTEYIIIGSIMILVPGLVFGTALRDLLCGDLLAGSLKTLQACLGALMIAFGYMLAGVVLGGAV